MTEQKSRRVLYSSKLKNFPERVEGLSPQDELNLYLVANGLKPASELILMSHFYETPKEKLNKKDLDDFKKLLESLGVRYNVMGNTFGLSWPLDPFLSVFIGRNEKDLRGLLEAKTDEEIGIALGYPKKAVRAYGKKVEGIVRNGKYEVVSAYEAEKSGKLPSWVAYISHVPEEADYLKGSIAKSSQSLGRRYEKFVKSNNPGLAKRVEEQHRNRMRPEEWRLDKGEYKVRYKEYPDDWF